MRESRSSGSVGAPFGNRWLYPEKRDFSSSLSDFALKLLEKWEKATRIEKYVMM